MAKSATQRQREYIERKKKGIKLPLCVSCGVVLKSDKTKKQCYCCRCFLQTLEGVLEEKERQKKYAKKRYV
jgi:hypothetical protein